MEKDGPTEQITDDNMPKRIAGWIPAATNTHSEYVLLTSLPLQQWLSGCTSMLRFTYLAVTL